MRTLDDHQAGVLIVYPNDSAGYYARAVVPQHCSALGKCCCDQWTHGDDIMHIN